ncbi:MAG TPA: hypothetical protein VFQ92_10295 [Blastocatellia bacterium]|nr:hypothetical protein [Blastocatellia bacterium]
MAESNTQKAIKAVAIACAATTTFVKIIGHKPFKVSPNNLFKLSFSSVGIVSDAQLEAFRQTLISILPDELRGDLQRMDLSPGIIIGLVVDHVEALLDALSVE